MILILRAQNTRATLTRLSYVDVEALGHVYSARERKGYSRELTQIPPVTRCINATTVVR